MKRCTKCKIVKGYNNFGKDRGKKDGLTCWCKKCRIEYIKSDKSILLQKESSHRYNKSPLGKYKNYIGRSKRHDRVFNLTFNQFKRFWQKPCYYCGDKIETIGLDRVDNNRGYEIKNIRSCCQQCNTMKFDYTEQEFINKCKKISILH